MQKQLNWDYTDHAKSYRLRPDYAKEAINDIVETVNLGAGSVVCEIGAGDGHLTKMLAGHVSQIHAIEPNGTMRSAGQKNTESFSDYVFWSNGTGEETGKPDKFCDLVIFGSSFNVTDRQKSLKESARILKSGGWFACLWNHRDLGDPLQADIERIIKSHIPDYGYGTRREDQADVIALSKLYNPAEKIERRVVHTIQRDLWLEAWKSHATLSRQAGENFQNIIQDICKHVHDRCGEFISIPYITRAWVASVKI
ncbi:MAG: class I SAM-dependent methyltransferase [Alphaproteobacteria bacterium]